MEFTRDEKDIVIKIGASCISYLADYIKRLPNFKSDLYKCEVEFIEDRILIIGLELKELRDLINEKKQVQKA